ncbi:sugar transferase [Rhodococcus sp. IEGM 1318]|uniref:sugar transferase n=1 Tax=Rhodococcus sp. IEGM 1318 TaxID=3082226 RepID=UPI002952D298|nr:sugar transferase [Rhodococcus sp. IEGM 1318]MDV8006340.1 sugar transferase [Rhodococcus sp. IEGM 1318]
MSVHVGVETKSELSPVRAFGPVSSSPAKVGEDWRQEYRRRIAVTDSVTVVLVIVLAQVVSMWPHPIEWLTPMKVGASVTLGGLWMIALARGRSRHQSMLGEGSDEYERVLLATGQVFGLGALAAIVLGVGIARSYLMIALPVGLGALLLGRYLWRRDILRKRSSGKCRNSVLLVGGHASVVATTRSFVRNASAGYDVVGACIPRRATAVDDHIMVDGTRIPVFGNEFEVVDAMRSSIADTVVVTGTEDLGQVGLRTLMWDLEAEGVDLVVSPVVADVSKARLMFRPVAGLPLIHVARPRYEGANHRLSAVFNAMFSVLIILLVSPVMAAAAIAVKATSKGSIFYKAERIGLNGKPFPMYKFRTMVQGADQQVTDLLGDNEGAGGVLFKMRADPRITPVGRILRRLSIDELPQFFNVLRGEMSVVGPRPPLRREVEMYDDEVARRLYVKPGITGLWQISGRSDLSWEDSVRLDSSYVENWSVAQDLSIIVRTVSAVVKSDGAY